MENSVNASPRISVVIAHYNYADYLGDAIESVLAQSCQPFEIIVVDDGSDDDTPQVLSRFRDSVTVITQNNHGVSAARNIGIRRARGEWIALLDSDDMWEPNLLAEYARATREHPRAGMITMGLRNILANGKRTVKTHGKSEPVQEFTTRSLLSGNAGLVITPLIRRDKFISVGGFDEGLYSAEDCDLALRLSRVTTIVALNKPLILKRIHKRNLSSNQRLNARMWLRVLDKLALTSPEFLAENQKTYRRVLGRDYLRLGRETLNSYRTPRQLAAARYYLAQSVRIYPGHLRGFSYLVWAYLCPYGYRTWRGWELRIQHLSRYRGEVPVSAG